MFSNAIEHWNQDIDNARPRSSYVPTVRYLSNRHPTWQRLQRARHSQAENLLKFYLSTLITYKINKIYTCIESIYTMLMLLGTEIKCIKMTLTSQNVAVVSLIFKLEYDL